MIDIEGSKAICAYCLIAAEGPPGGQGSGLMVETTNASMPRDPVTSAMNLVPRVDGHRTFEIYGKGTTTCWPVTVVNGTWICAVHVRDAVTAGGRLR